MNNIRPITIWFTGLSASGKSTLSERLYNDLNELNIKNVELLDGESIRDMLKMYDFDPDSREQIGIYKAKIALNLNKEGKIVLVSGIAHKKKWRNDLRSMFDDYFEIFLDCNLDACIKRDYKGNYQKAISGKLDNFIGISEPYELSGEYNLILDTDKNSIEFCSKEILKSVLSFMNKG